MRRYSCTALTENPNRKIWAGQRVVVTGGAGLIGSRLYQRLVRAGAHVRLFDRLDAYEHQTLRHFGVSHDDVNLTIADIRDRRTVRRAIVDADYVIHSAAYADVAACTHDPFRAFASNLHATEVLLEEIARTSQIKRLILYSSASVYGNGTRSTEGPPCFSEDDPVAPLSIYGNAKQWAEHQMRLLLDEVVPYTILRLFSVYGAPQVPKRYSHSWAVAWFAMRAIVGLPMEVHGDGSQVRDFIHVDDVADATIRALASPAAVGQTINIGTGKPTSIRRLAGAIKQHFPRTRIRTTPRPTGDPTGGYADTTRMHRLLDWTPPICVEQGVPAYIDWLQRHPEVVPNWLTEAQDRDRLITNASGPDARLAGLNYAGDGHG
ncbi:NAD-dependent epimerase/dehydratase family protein [Haloechinothrix sp. YIM 98757]|uniref:NAD-dependent epimerase/dehydratase family protein n=1 Tax=Haloechinothrix aidingensis TaxID=2752311 RepID=A0A838ADI0_9PSEU|nr:NAD-dependent epimerase/dehydratase family protein [Haloechinothrix aidingensis]MBA0127247.1 NAD-dependent epimerase/dehydratase family protein [Haloechinothrix aidingensis]